MTLLDSPLVIETGEAFPVCLDFRVSVSHHLKTREYTENVIVRLNSESGETGYGEGVPRDYITGETPESALESLDRFLPTVAGRSFANTDELIQALTTLGTSEEGTTHPTAVCAFELAALDLAGRFWDIPVGKLLGLPASSSPLSYNLVIPYFEDASLFLLLDQAVEFGFRQVKIKVTADDPAGRVRTIRERLGDDVELRVDTNCAWDRSNAPGFMRELANLGVVSVEQPLASDDIEGNRILRGPGLPLVTLDESVRSVADIDRIAALGAADVINIRISKCGGLIHSLSMIEAAERHGLMVQMGAHVGESCILSAAGVTLAAGYPAFRWLEGCFGTHLLTRDLTRQEYQFSAGGLFTPPVGAGLGVTIDEDRIERAKASCSGRSGRVETCWMSDAN